MNITDAMKLLLSDRKLLIESVLTIEDKNRQSVPMKLWPIQARMLADCSGRDIFVKPGQVGASSLFIGDFLCDNIIISGTVSVIVSYDEFIAGRLLRKAKLFYQSLKRRIPSIPDLDHKSTYELTFKKEGKVPFHSSFYIYSAQSYTIGRGETIHNLLMDELAFWPVGAVPDVFASALNRVPLIPGTKVRIVSTPNGEDNDFCETYRAAKEGKAVGRSVFKHHFYTWWLHPEYSMEADSTYALPGDEAAILPNLQPEEVSLMMVFQTMGLTAEEGYNKLRWRRYKRAEMASLHRSGDTEILFAQEFPEDDETCFISAGDQYYDAVAITAKLRECYPAPQHICRADIWFPPEKDCSYILGIDPGRGKTSESVAQVWRFYEIEGGVPVFQHCATLAGWYDEPEMAIYCKELGRYYNDAVIAPEDNLSIVNHLRDYPELYYREDLRNGSVTRAIGWQTNVSTKPFMCSELNRHIEHITCFDQRFWSQCKNIRRDRGSRSGIRVIGSDDHHDSAAIAIACRSAQPVARGFVGVSGWPDSWGKV